MNGWVVTIAVGLVLVLAFRAWFRWFSRRPLSTVDHYARVVDTSVDAVDGDGPPGPPARAVTGPAGSRPPGRHPASSPVVGSTPATPRTPFPRQRSVADADAAAERPRTPPQPR